jgi:hypothetical protein
MLTGTFSAHSSVYYNPAQCEGILLALCVCVCARACVRACVCVGARARAHCWLIIVCLYPLFDVRQYLIDTNLLMLTQRMPDMSNLHEVQTVDMLPPDMNSQFRQVKLCCGIILPFLTACCISVSSTSASYF